MDLHRILDLDSRATDESILPTRKRFCFGRLKAITGRPFVALLGPRGSGKTVMLRQLRSEMKDSIYISADTLEPDDRLTEIVRALADRYRIRSFLIDEVHFLSEYPRDLKELYDFSDLEVWFTSSVALSLHSTSWDLSRRVLVQKLLPFSFREYLSFSRGLDLPALLLGQVLRDEVPAEYLRTDRWFDPYLQGGLYPFMLERGAGLELFRSVLDTVVNRDIPAHDRSVTHDDLLKIARLLRFIGASPVDGINYSSISSNIGVTKYMAEKYVGHLERSFILRRALPAGTNVVREPKIFMDPPYRLLYRPFVECVGEIREDFFALAMEQHGITFSYAKTKRGGKTPDFLLDEGGRRVILEVGGKSKGRTQFKELDYDAKIVLAHATGAIPEAGRRVPLHCIGFPP